MKFIKIIISILIILSLIGGIWWTKYQWGLCRDAGMNFWYCIQHIG